MFKMTGVLCLLALITACSATGGKVENNYSQFTLKSGTIITNNPSIFGDKIAEKAMQLGKNKINRPGLNLPPSKFKLVILEPEELGFGPDDSTFTRPTIKDPAMAKYDDFDICYVKYEDYLAAYIACASGISAP